VFGFNHVANFVRVPRACLVTSIVAFLAGSAAAQSSPKNVILFIGDGMGLEAVKLGRVYDNGNTAPLSFENPAYFPHSATMTHNNASGALTDSAASGTAMATGEKVANGVISIRTPGDGADLPTALEVFKARGKRTGLVTHDVDMLDATPASFGAHTSTRTDRAGIFADYMNGSQPNVLFGQTNAAINSATAVSKGYTVVNSSLGLQGLAGNESHVLGHWTTGDEPTLSAQTTRALDLLDNDPSGFFLMVEEEKTDNGAHSNTRTGTIAGVLGLRDAVDAALVWAAGRTDTLIIITADHETGGLTVLPGPYQAGVKPAVTWSTTGHTTTPVGVWAVGPNAYMVTGQIDNTNIFQIVTAVPEPGMGIVIIVAAGLAHRRPARRRVSN
jgi:alkaline phosphatase